MTDYVRGQSIRFSTTFTDADGDPHTPTAPVVVIDFPHGRSKRTQTTLDLAQDGSEWVATWDSGEASRAGVVRWTVYSSAPEPKIASEGEFNLTANSANLVAV